jgi:hypothetical protein
LARIEARETLPRAAHRRPRGGLGKILIDTPVFS